MKAQKIRERLEMLERDLANAEAYIARNVNVRRGSLFHLGDWRGNSGHPLWMKNHMVPCTKRTRARIERTLERITTREEEKRKMHRTRRPAR
jgi:hypothetical protein